MAEPTKDQELLRLEREAAELDAQEAPAVVEVGQGEPAAAGPDPLSEIDGMIQIVVGLLGPVYPSLAKVYTPATRQQLAGAIVPVMEKHGWSLGSLYGEWAEEITLAMVALPVGLATWAAVKADNAARVKAQQEEPQPPADNADH